ncbi:hypothetical protein KKB40_05165, partial [Patescibacteria group bacterium]|nr:hypothetical protein [Patescibacteria group bacterium]
MKVQDVVEAEISNMPFSKNVTAVVPSIWGWGGMKFSLMVEQQDIVNLKLNGYIAQLATGPLRKVMDNFLEKLSVSLKNNYQYNFEYQKTSGLVPKSKAKLNKKDTTIIVIM